MAPGYMSASPVRQSHSALPVVGDRGLLLSSSPKARRSSKALAVTVSTALMQAQDAGQVGHALPTASGLSKHHDLHGLRPFSSTSSPSLLRPLRPLHSSLATWQDDDKTLYSSAHHAWSAGYDSEVEFSPAQRQHACVSRGQRARSPFGQSESETRFGWPHRSSASSPQTLSLVRPSLHAMTEDDWDGRILHGEFERKVAAARQHSTDPGARFEPFEGGLGGEALSVAGSAKGPTSGLDVQAVSSRVEQVIEERNSPNRLFPDSLKERYEYFLEMSGTAAWTRLDEDLDAKKMSFDIVEEEQVYSDMLEQAIVMVEVRILLLVSLVVIYDRFGRPVVCAVRLNMVFFRQTDSWGFTSNTSQT